MFKFHVKNVNVKKERYKYGLFAVALRNNVLVEQEKNFLKL